MNKLAKIGATALCGSLVAVASQAGELTVTGGSTATWSSNSGDKVGNPIDQDDPDAVVNADVIRLDNVKPTIDILYPITDAYVNSNSFSYTLSETVVEGRVSWFGTGGADNGVTKEIQQDNDWQRYLLMVGLHQIQHLSIGK